MTFQELPNDLQNEILANGISPNEIERLARRSNRNGHHVTVFTKSGGRKRFRKPSSMFGQSSAWFCDMDGAKSSEFDWS